MKRLKPLLPSLKERKRYVAFRVEGRERYRTEAIREHLLSWLGILGAARAGIMLLASGPQAGIVRTSAASADDVRTALTSCTSLESRPARVRVVGVSGVLRQAKAMIEKRGR